MPVLSRCGEGLAGKKLLDDMLGGRVVVAQPAQSVGQRESGGRGAADSRPAMNQKRLLAIPVAGKGNQAIYMLAAGWMLASGRIADVIECDFPRDRTLEIRETPEFLKIAKRVRAGLRSGHSYDE